MRTPTTCPTGQPQPFDVTETFFSTTDPRGVITAGNAVFCRTSGYSLPEMVGQPHNLIRHPEMPRVAFRLLWDAIRAGRPFMGYVKNQAKNGNHYWVFAVIVPLPQRYLSVRIKPTSELLGTIEALYQRLADAEAAAVAQGRSESQAADASAARLPAELAALGFSTYEAFSHHALNAEIKRRDAEISRRGLRLFPEQLQLPEGSAEAGRLGALYREMLEVYAGINDLFASLDGFNAACTGIRSRKDAVQSISEDFRLNALNAHIAANPLGFEGITLGTVAQLLNAHAHSLSQNVGSLADSIMGTTTAVNDITSNLSAARIQVEMFLSFLAEIVAMRDERADLVQLNLMTEDLRAGFSTTLRQAISAMAVVRARVPQVLAAKERLRKDIVYLQVAQISGFIEVARLKDDGGLHATFTGLRAQIEVGKRELDALGNVADQLRALTNAAPPKVRRIERGLAAAERARGSAGPAEAGGSHATNGHEPLVLGTPVRIAAGSR